MSAEPLDVTAQNMPGANEQEDGKQHQKEPQADNQYP
jgi:hypothetical protein